jgi:hypothetical protein
MEIFLTLSGKSSRCKPYEIKDQELKIQVVCCFINRSGWSVVRSSTTEVSTLGFQGPNLQVV